MGHGSSKDDAKRYRDGYPGKGDDPSINANADFYQNKIRSVPHGTFLWVYVVDMLQEIKSTLFIKPGLVIMISLKRYTALSYIFYAYA